VGGKASSFRCSMIAFSMARGALSRVTPRLLPSPLLGESRASGVPEDWRRVVAAPGVELHVRRDRPRPRAAELKELLEGVERALRRCFR